MRAAPRLTHLGAGGWTVASANKRREKSSLGAARMSACATLSALRIFISIGGPKAHGGQDWRRYLTALAVPRPPPPSSNRPTADPSRVPSGQISPAESRADSWRRWLEPQS